MRLHPSLRLLPLIGLLLAGSLLLPSCSDSDKKPAATKKGGKKKKAKKLTEEELLYELHLCDVETKVIASSELSEDEQAQAFSKYLPKARQFAPHIRKAGGYMVLGRKAIQPIIERQRALAEFAQKNKLTPEQIMKAPEQLPDHLRKYVSHTAKLYAQYRVPLDKKLADPLLSSSKDFTPLQKAYVSFAFACQGIPVDKQIATSLSSPEQIAAELCKILGETNDILTSSKSAEDKADELQKHNIHQYSFALALRDNQELAQKVHQIYSNTPELREAWQKRQQNLRKLQETNYLDCPELNASADTSMLIWNHCGAHVLNQ